VGKTGGLARLIGQKVKVEVYESELKIYAGRECLLTLPRRRGDRGTAIDYRHVIEHLLRKPGAFAQYRFREELFPSPTYRRMYDRFVEQEGQRRGELEYLRLLKLTAESSLGVPLEQSTYGLESLLSECLSPGRKVTVDGLRRLLGIDQKPELALEEAPINLSAYDGLLEETSGMGEASDVA